MATSQPTEIESDAVCRICHDGHTKSSPLFHPCLCNGSIRYIHEKCLNTWLKHNKSGKCEVCKHNFIYSPIFVAGQTVPSSITVQSLIDITQWILDELFMKNSEIFMRLLLILLLWLLVAPNIILQTNRIFYKFFIIYDIIHFNAIYTPFHALKHAIQVCKSFKLHTLTSSSVQCILSCVCPYQWTLSLNAYLTRTVVSNIICNGFKGLLCMVIVLLICGIGLCMKNSSKVVRAPQTHLNTAIVQSENETENEQKIEENIENNDKVSEMVNKPKRKNAMFDCEDMDTEYKSPSLLCDNDSKDYDSDGNTSVSSTLSELETRLSELQTRIEQKRAQTMEEQKNEEMNIEDNNGNADVEINEEIDELVLLLDTIGMNDEYENLVIKHTYWILWVLNNHFSHFILPHLAGQCMVNIMYGLGYVFLSTDSYFMRTCLDLIDFNQYSQETFIFTAMIRNVSVVIIGYVSCFVYQWLLSKIMLTIVHDLQQFLRVSVRQKSSIIIFNIYIWLFDKMDIFKGVFFLFLKFVLFPFILTLSMECCALPVREESQLKKYVVLYETFIVNTQSKDTKMDNSTASAVIYLILMLLWTFVAICTYLSTVDILEKVMRPTAFTWFFRSVIETKNWVHPFSYQEQSSVQFRKWCMTTLHFVTVIFAFLGIPSCVMSQCEHIVPLNVPSLGKIKSFHVRSLLLQDYVLLFSILPMFVFWEPLFRALVIHTLRISAYVFNLKFYLLRNYQSTEERRMEVLDQNVWHNQQPFLHNDNDMEIPPIPQEHPLEIESDSEVNELIDSIVNDLIDNALQYTLDSVSNEIIHENNVIKSITECIEFMTNSNLEIEEQKILEASSDDRDNIQEIEAIIDHVCNDNEQFGPLFDYYRVKWRAFSLAESTWEPMQHLTDAMELIDSYNNQLKSKNVVLSETYWNNQIFLGILWMQLTANEGKKDNHFGVVWVSEGNAFQIVDTHKFVQFFLSITNCEDKYDAFVHRMVSLGFEMDSDSHLFHHPCFHSKSEKLIALIGRNRVDFTLEWTADNIKYECEETKEEKTDENHRYYAAYLDEPNNEIIEIPEQKQNDIIEPEPNNVNDNANEDDLDMMGLFDGIDLGGSENIIPAPIVMNVQLDNFGRLIKINVELDTYNEIKENNDSNTQEINEEIIPENDVGNVLEHIHENNEEKVEQKQDNAGIEERVHVRELMRSLNSYQKSELLRDILSICHTIYISEDKYAFIYNHNTKADMNHPLIRVLKRPSQLISINDIVSLCDKLLLYFRIFLILIIAIIALNVFHLILFLQCLVYGRKLWKILSLIPNFFIFQLGYTNFTRFDNYGIMSFAFNTHTIHDLHCIALSLWWFPACYYILNLIYTLGINILNKCSKCVDTCFDLMFEDRRMSDNAVSSSLSNIIRTLLYKIVYCAQYIAIFLIHHILLPLLFGFTFQFALWSPVFVGHNQSFCLSILEAWIEGFVVWNVFLPIMPLSVIISCDSNEFKQKFKTYLETKFRNMNLIENCTNIYWPFLKLIIIHLFLPIAFIQSGVFKYIWNEYNDIFLHEMKNYNTKMAVNSELIFEFNKKFYLRYITRMLLQIRLFIAYKRGIKNGCNKVWNQFINDKYVVGRKLVNYYYNKSDKTKN